MPGLCGRPSVDELVKAYQRGEHIMARGASRFRQTDLVRAIKAAKAAGEEVSKIEVDAGGKLRIILGKPVEAQSGPGSRE